MSVRIAVISEIPTPYRQPLLKQMVNNSSWHMDVYFLSQHQSDRLWQLEVTEPYFHQFPGTQLCVPGYHTVYVNWAFIHRLFAKPYDLYIVGGYAQPALLRILLELWRRKIPYIMMTESHLHKPRSRWLESVKEPYLRRVYSRSAGNLVASSWAKDYVVHYGADPDKVVLFPNTVDPPTFRRAVEQQATAAQCFRQQHALNDQFVFLFVGTFNRRKGFDLLLDAFAQLQIRCPNTALMMVGAGKLQSQAMKLQRQLGTHKVILPGYIQPEQLPLYYAVADTLVLPSRDEPFGAVVCEALSANVPVIVSEHVAANEYVNDLHMGEVITLECSALLKAMAGRINQGAQGQSPRISWLGAAIPSYDALAQNVRELMVHGV